MLWPGELLQNTAVYVNTSKCKIRVATAAPAARVESGGIFWVIKKSKAVDTFPTNQTLSFGTVGTIVLVIMRVVKVASIKTRVREIRRLQSCWWKFVDVDYFDQPMSTHNHSVSDLNGNCLKSVYFSSSFILLKGAFTTY